MSSDKISVSEVSLADFKYQPRAESRKFSLPRIEIHLSDRTKAMLRRFWKRNGVAIIALLFFWGYTFGLVKGTEVRVRKEVTARVTAELRAEFEQTLADQERERQMAAFLSDDASKRAMIEAESESIAKAFYGAREVIKSTEDLMTYGWTICFRSEEENSEFPSSIEGVVAQKGAFMGYSEDNPVIERYYSVAKEIATAYHDGSWPTTAKFLYLDWSTGKMIARDELKTGPRTEYWWWGK